MYAFYYKCIIEIYLYFQKYVYNIFYIYYSILYLNIFIISENYIMIYQTVQTVEPSKHHTLCKTL